MDRGFYKKATFEDKFARKFYCHGASWRYTKYAKRYNNRVFRKQLKREQERIE